MDGKDMGFIHINKGIQSWVIYRIDRLVVTTSRPIIHIDRWH